MAVDMNNERQVHSTFAPQKFEIEVPEGEELKIENTFGNDDTLRGIVPAGKKWRYSISVTLIEEDV